MRAAVVAGGDGAKPLLARRVPLIKRCSSVSKLIRLLADVEGFAHNLQFDGLAVQFDGSDLKVHSDGADITLRVCVILQRGQM